ncbi:MAG: hypothetical protein RIS76_4739 [Verrucomicrobiota bacterium]
MNLLDEKFLWASLIWGALGSGYLVYGWRQKEPLPTIAGVVLLGVSYLVGSWLLMSVIAGGTIALVHFLQRR